MIVKDSKLLIKFISQFRSTALTNEYNSLRTSGKEIRNFDHAHVGLFNVQITNFG